MTREEAIKTLKDRIEQYTGGVHPGEREILLEAFAVLRPTPDPDTGLVPCGCGGKAVVVPKDNGFYIVCNSCEVSTTQDSFFNGTGFSAQSLDDAKEDWNAAMGYKGGAE